MRERLTVQRSIYFTESLAEKIEIECDKLGIRFSELVRDCVENDLPRFRERNRKRILKRKHAENANQA